MPNDRTRGVGQSLPEGFGELLGTDLYRRNAFRVLGVPIDATPQSVVRSKKLREMQEQLGLAQAASSEYASLLPISPPPDSEALRRATECLQDPVLRFMHGFFWLWPSEPSPGPSVALSALARAHPADVLKDWLRVAESATGTVTIRHNTAVLAHLLALDIEARASGSSPGSPEYESGSTFWEIAYQQWNRLRDEPELWQKLRGLQDREDDPRLPADIAHRLQGWCPDVIVGTTARLLTAVAARETKAGVLRSVLDEVGKSFFPGPTTSSTKATGRGEVPAPATAIALLEHTQLLGKAGWDAGALDRAIALELLPTLERIRMLGKQLSDFTPATPREPFHETLDAVLQELAVVETLLAENNPQRSAAMDVVIGAVLEVGISHGNDDHEWPRWLALVNHLRDRATGPVLRDRLTRTTEVLQDNIEAAEREVGLARAIQEGTATDVVIKSTSMRVPQMCTCCLGTPEVERSYSYSWEEQESFRKVRHTVTHQYPLCAECERHRGGAQSAGIWLVALSVVLAGVLGRAGRLLPEPNGWVVASASTLAAILGMMVFARWLRYGPLADSHACQGESVKIRFAQGGGAVVTFMNPIYAQAFAEANGLSTSPPRPSGAYRGVSPLGGSAGRKRALVVLACGMIASWITFSGGERSGTNMSSVQTSVRALPPTRYSNPASESSSPGQSSQPVPTPRRTGANMSYQRSLAAEIDAEKTRLRQLELELQSGQEELESLLSEISTYVALIEDYERTARLGGNVDEIAYQVAIDAHNRRVESYNTRLDRYRNLLEDYKALLDSVNSKVDEYNRGLH